MDNSIGNNGELQFANGQSSRDLRASSGNLHKRTDSSDPLEALRRDSDEVLERRTQYHQREAVRNDLEPFPGNRGATTPDAIHQAYGLVESMMTQQATML